MREPIRSGQFKRDTRTAEKRGRDMGKLRALLVLLIEGRPLPAEYLDHPLKDKWNGYRDAHIEPDWLLIYRILVTNDSQPTLRVGTASVA